MSHLLPMLLMAMLGLAALAQPTAPPEPVTPTTAQDTTVFLPLMRGAPSIAGTYDCYEYEFGMIWTSEVVTLYPDHTSLYVYGPPYASVMTGTWTYTPTTQLVGFTNFRWITATVQLPDRLWAARYVESEGFEVVLNCTKRDVWEP